MQLTIDCLLWEYEEILCYLWYISDSSVLPVIFTDVSKSYEFMDVGIEPNVFIH